MPSQVLIVDDDSAIRELLREFLAEEGLATSEAASAAEARQALETSDPDVILLDMWLPDGDGLDVLDSLRGRPEIPVIVITADSSSSRTIRAMQAGAFDYLVKPLEPEAVRAALRRALDQRRMARDLRATVLPDGRERIVGSGTAMQAVYKLIGRIADAQASVLITGETGTGKELVAETLHQNSSRRAGPLIRVNCAALPESLLESELFGHEKGSFTGAIGLRKGRFELAHGGTIFLDEVGELSPSTQKKLLRVLQFGEFERVGGAVTLRSDARVVAATNRDLEAEVQKGHFREDLYYRLNVLRIALPPLRERRDDFPALIAHFLDRYRPAPGAPPAKISGPAMRQLIAGDWPGNVRQLENSIQQAVVLSGGRVITPEHLRQMPLSVTPEKNHLDLAALVRESVPLKSVLAKVEREMIVEALRQAAGNRSEAARMLHIYRRLLYEKIEEYGLGTGTKERD
ncbi:MAG: sigma-54-dependent transcriptional regulator [Anaerolineae bacterium]|jgi:two-component system response regulator AtoC|nr:sigma-54-dependent Fis family transcriptional regulator [Ardenticatenia bacterium]MBK8539966.1 sigma-54-dependent Fis family transcriptional regulator [Ardenticatenia bacterium]HQZ69776.1 sigma-54 dependent transcriptional regulator [Anaerolineae bacterium]HRA18991.1 sigma-54 dependent transcriptional regulator [Anaerolineae bacterium]